MQQIKVTGTKLTKDFVSVIQKWGHKITLRNLFIFKWESDIFTIDKDGMISEYEVKVSKSDFNADFLKQEKHSNLEQMNGSLPNYFWYVVPKGMIDENDVPEYAGLMYYIGPGWYNVVKKAPLLHDKNITEYLWEEIAMKLYYKFMI